MPDTFALTNVPPAEKVRRSTPVDLVIDGHPYRAFPVDNYGRAILPFHAPGSLFGMRSSDYAGLVAGMAARGVRHLGYDVVLNKAEAAELAGASS